MLEYFPKFRSKESVVECVCQNRKAKFKEGRAPFSNWVLLVFKEAFIASVIKWVVLFWKKRLDYVLGSCQRKMHW